MKKNTTELGKAISEAREKAGISQRKLARLANMDCAEVSRIEAGKRLKPNVLYLKGIAENLGLSLVKLMKLAGYNDIDINWGRDLTEKRSTKDYQEQIKEYERFCFDILKDIDNRRDNAFACKGVIADLIDRIELAKIENKEISNEDILEDLKRILILIRPNLEKADKSIYPKVDMGLFPKTELSSNKTKYPRYTEILNKEK